MQLRETNLDAQLFFRQMGFNATGVSREHYPDSGEDAFIMEQAPNLESAESVLDHRWREAPMKHYRKLLSMLESLQVA